MSADTRRILITGGAGFVGSGLAISIRRRHPGWQVVVLDSLRRRGSELNLPRLQEVGVEFVQGDVRILSDVLEGERVDAVIDCSAEPSVLAGVGGDPAFVMGTNLVGAYHCLERARRDSAQFIFLSTSRVYPFDSLAELKIVEDETRFALRDEQPFVGVGPLGISEEFPLDGVRSLYGATKLAAEYVAREYGATYGFPVTVNRCGVVAGPWQFGKVDQGVVAHWVLAHHFGRPLSYLGWGGTGKQVRDLLHVDDLARLVGEQLSHPDAWNGVTANVGGGVDGSLSLLELTNLCREIVGETVPISGTDDSRAGDIPVYLSNCSLLFGLTNWRPMLSPRDIVSDVAAWVRDNEAALERAIG